MKTLIKASVLIVVLFFLSLGLNYFLNWDATFNGQAVKFRMKPGQVLQIKDSKGNVLAVTNPLQETIVIVSAKDSEK